MRTVTLRFTAAELRHLLHVLFEDNEEPGYEGGSAAYFLRADRLKDRLSAALKKLGAQP